MAKESVESLCQKAQQALAKGQNEEARQLYIQALALRSDSPDVHYGLATVYFLLNDLTNSAFHFKEVTRLDPLRAGAYINLGAVLNRLDQLDEAIPFLRRGIQLDMNRAEGYYNLGLVYRRKGQNDLAINAYREAVRLNPRMADAHYNLGNLYLEKGNPQLAANHYRLALEIKPNWEKASNGLEQAEQSLAELEEREKPANTQGASPANEKEIPIPGPVNLDPDRTVDPQFHGALLSSLHKATIDSDNQSRNLLKLVETEMEPAIKELSNVLLYPDSSATEVDHCLQKFQAAMTSLRSAQTNLRNSIDRVRLLGEQLLKM